MSFVRTLINAYRLPGLRALNGSPIERADPRVVNVLKSEGVVQLSAWCPQHSVFDRYNRLFTFDRGQLFGCSNFQVNALSNALVNLVSVHGPDHAAFSLADLSSLSTSKSASNDNAYRWETMAAFGQWANDTHLPQTIGGTNDPKANREALLSVFRQNVLTQRGGFSGVRYQRWCNRYLAINSGISRRLSAMAYLASCQDLDLGAPINVPCWVERLNHDAMATVDREAEIYVLIADADIQRQLIDVLQSILAPVAVYALRDQVPLNQAPYLYCLPRVNPKEPNFGFGELQTNKTLFAQQLRLKSIFDTALDDGALAPLPEYIRHVSACLTA